MGETISLTNDEFEMLQESLDAYEKEESRSDILNSMITSLFAPDKETRDKILKEKEIEFEKDKEKRQLLKERIILLKAKLIQIKINNSINHLINVSNI